MTDRNENFSENNKWNLLPSPSTEFHNTRYRYGEQLFRDSFKKLLSVAEKKDCSTW